jgi:glucosamine 6-phosphate synthetase-like amidotransferase/phosphosugar isomerase protein
MSRRYNTTGHDVSRLTYFALFALQHRGQESAGIAAADAGRYIITQRALGLVSQVFKEHDLQALGGDLALGDPQRCHPVAGFGTTASSLERVLYADSRARGVVHTGVLVGGAVALGAVVERRLPLVLSTAVATWAVLRGRSLEREALAVHTSLVATDLPAAVHRPYEDGIRDAARLVGELHLEAGNLLQVIDAARAANRRCGCER